MVQVHHDEGRLSGRKIDDQIKLDPAADRGKDQKALETLGKQADELSQKIGPEYVELTHGLDQINPDSSEGKEFSGLLAPLDNLCSK